MGSKSGRARVASTLRSALAAAALTVPMFMSTASAAPLTYVDSFNVFDGRSADSAPRAMSARQIAALLFGGAYTDYAISTSSSRDWTTVTHTAWVDGFFDPQFLLTAASEDFYSGDSDGLYTDFGNYSAYVCDHAECQSAGFDVNAGQDGLNYTNYVWRITDASPVPVPVPEPVAPAIVLAGLGGMWLARRKTRRAA